MHLGEKFNHLLRPFEQPHLAGSPHFWADLTSFGINHVTGFSSYPLQLHYQQGALTCYWLVLFHLLLSGEVPVDTGTADTWPVKVYWSSLPLVIDLEKEKQGLNLKCSSFLDPQSACKLSLTHTSMYPLPDIQPWSLFVQLHGVFQMWPLPTSKRLQDTKTGAQPHTSTILSLLSAHTLRNWENTHLTPRQLLLGTLFFRSVLAYANTSMPPDAHD